MKRNVDKNQGGQCKTCLVLLRIPHVHLYGASLHMYIVEYMLIWYMGSMKYLPRMVDRSEAKIGHRKRWLVNTNVEKEKEVEKNDSGGKRHAIVTGMSERKRGRRRGRGSEEIFRWIARRGLLIPSQSNFEIPSTFRAISPPTSF